MCTYMSRSDVWRKSPSRLSCFSFATSAVGTFSIACTSPERSAATRAASLVMSRSVTFSQGVLPPHQASLRTSSIRSPFA